VSITAAWKRQAFQLGFQLFVQWPEFDLCLAFWASLLRSAAFADAGLAIRALKVLIMNQSALGALKPTLDLLFILDSASVSRYDLKSHLHSLLYHSQVLFILRLDGLFIWSQMPGAPEWRLF
jgi:hypothetical protein